MYDVDLRYDFENCDVNMEIIEYIDQHYKHVWKQYDDIICMYFQKEQYYIISLYVFSFFLLQNRQNHFVMYKKKI